VTAGRFSFVCLEERRSQRARLDKILSPLGDLRWRSFPPLSLRGFPETPARALEAYNRGTEPPQRGLLRALKLRLLGWQYNGARRYFAKNPGLTAVAWNAQAGHRRVFMQAARDAGARRLFFELGPFAGTITADPCGVNFVNALPREIAPYLAWAAARQGATGDWRALGAAIRQRAPSGAAKHSPAGAPPLDEPFLFAPLQYPGDSQLRIFGGAYPSVEVFVDALAEASDALPEGWHLRLKEHPTAPVSLAARIAELGAGKRIYLDNTTETFTQVRASRGVVTVNSSVGLEAMFFDKPVIAGGQCFWAIDGIADHAPDRAALAALFARAEALGFDPAARDAFLGFLTQEYYPHLRQDDLPPEARAAELAKITRRLAPPPGDPVWTGQCPVQEGKPC